MAKDNRFTLIKQANSVSLKTILSNYDNYIDDFNTKIICPFPFHQEQTASFNYYPDSNSFYCFGCSNGGGPVEFIALFYSLEKDEAANKIINNYQKYINGEIEENKTNWKERQSYLFEFSSIIRKFVKENKNEEALKFVDKVCKEFDEVFYKHPNMNVKGYQFLLGELKERIKSFNV